MSNSMEHPSYNAEDVEIKTPEELEEAKKEAGVAKSHEEIVKRLDEMDKNQITREKKIELLKEYFQKAATEDKSLTLFLKNGHLWEGKVAEVLEDAVVLWLDNGGYSPHNIPPHNQKEKVFFDEIDFPQKR